jgi:hypothetical protein
LHAEVVDNRECDASRSNALAAELIFDSKHGCCNVSKVSDSLKIFDTSNLSAKIRGSKNL